MPGGLIVVSGLPASGKTSLSRVLATEFGFVHIRRDGQRHAFDSIVNSLGPENTFLVGRALDELINDFARSVLTARQGAVIDSNFNVPEQHEAVRALVAELGCPCFEVCLWADPVVLRERFRLRADPPLTDELLPYFEMVLARERKPVLGAPVPMVAVDTTDFATLEREREGIIGQIRSSLDL